jgi:hypothetical protein
VSLDIGRLGTTVQLTFAEISFDKAGEPHAKLREWKGQYREVEDVR